MSRFGLIVGSGALPWQVDWVPVGSAGTAYGAASMVPEQARVGGIEVIRLARHGVPHHIAPHAVNYRANVRALVDLGVAGVVAINTVGGIGAAAATGRLLVSDQIFLYTSGRAQTFSPDDAVVHVDFSEPYDAGLRERLLRAGDDAGLDVADGGTMGVTQGPRLETVAEIRRMARDGCAVVGMTGMPEAVLARELELPFASLSLVVNPAAGIGAAAAVDLAELRAVSARGMADAGALLLRFFEGAQ